MKNTRVVYSANNINNKRTPNKKFCNRQDSDNQLMPTIKK